MRTFVDPLRGSDDNATLPGYFDRTEDAERLRKRKPLATLTQAMKSMQERGPLLFGESITIVGVGVNELPSPVIPDVLRDWRPKS